MGVVSLFRSAPSARNWTNQELAEFYRVEAALARAGLSVSVDSGLSDEGDPWYVFHQPDTGDVIVHFARLGSIYVIASGALGQTKRGTDFRAMVRELIDAHPVTINRERDGTRSKFSIHPAALLVALVMTCYFKLSQTDAHADELAAAPGERNGSAGHEAARSGGLRLSAEAQGGVFLAAIAFAIGYADDELSAAGAPTSLLETAAASDEAPPTIVASLASGATNVPESQISRLQNASDNSAPIVGESDGPAKSTASEADHAAGTAPAPAGSPGGGPGGETTIVRPAPEATAFHEPAGPNLPGDPTHQAEAAPVQIAGVLGTVEQTLGPAAHAHEAAPETVDTTLVSFFHDLVRNQPVGTAVEGVYAVIHAETASSTGIETQTVVTVPTAATGGTTITAQTGDSALLQTAASALLQFTGAHPDYRILSLEHEVIIYDIHITDVLGHALETHSYAFSDGSTIVIVGLAPDYHVGV